MAFLSLAWCATTSVMLFFPQKIDPVLGFTKDNYNYTWVVVLITLLMAALYWYLPASLGGARHHFEGPQVVVREESDINTTVN